MSIHNLTRFLSVAVTISAISCSDSTSPPPVPGSLEIVSGDGQVGTVAAELPGPLTVRLLDTNGKPIARREVRFVVAAGGGTLSAASAITDGNCSLLAINRNDLLALVKAKPAFAVSLLKAVAERLRRMT